MPPRKKTELYNLVDRVIHLFRDDKKSLREIEALLREEGFDISRGSIHRTLKDYNAAAELFEEGTRQAEMLLEAVRSQPNTDILEVASTLLAKHILDYVKDIDEILEADPAELSKAIARLSRAQVNVARLRLEHQKGFEAAKKAVLSALGRELTKEPDLLDRLKAVVAGLEPHD